MPTHRFVTLYFPGERTRSGSAAKVTISLPNASTDAFPKPFLDYAHALTGKEFRDALGNPYLDDLEDAAKDQGRSLSNVCVIRLAEAFRDRTQAVVKKSTQLTLPFDHEAPNSQPEAGGEDGGFGVTFRESQRLPVHSWYPYVEGFSARYVRDAIVRFGDHPQCVYDPFGGSGTTQLVAATMGIPSFYSEVNPFMAFVADTKVNVAAWARQHLPAVRKIASRFLSDLREATLETEGGRADLSGYETAFPKRDFFEDRHLRHLIAAKQLAESLTENAPQVRALLRLACAANVVRSSNMTRRADLRRRRPDEYKGRVVNVAHFVRESVERILSDLEELPVKMAGTTKLASDSRELGDAYENRFSTVITSPPYLNGTNYIRNAKLELWYLGFLGSEDDLAGFRKQTVCAGINDVSKARSEHTRFDNVEAVAGQLDVKTKDRRIPTMVRQYFSDMGRVFASCLRSLAPGGRLVLDIGDSQFYGVHVPTDELLIDVARSVGLQFDHKHYLAPRYSRGDVELKQFELVFSKPSTIPLPRRHAEETTKSKIERFAEATPYKNEPYVSRNWGQPLHSLCSYQGKLKPGLAHWLVRSFVPPGGSVLDPLGGVGTIPFEAALTGRRAVSNDKSPFASIVAAAKLNPPPLADALAAIDAFEEKLGTVTLADADYTEAKFGLNGSVTDYYHPDTLAEVLKARRLFLAEGRGDRTQTFLWASLLHILHGNRPYALSRNSHPVTPFAPSGPTEYRPLIDRLRGRVERALSEPLPPEFLPGTGLHGDFRALPDTLGDPFDAVITSPPFMGMRFDRPNWLRMWFCGWGERSFHETSLTFLERQQTKSLECYSDFFNTCFRLLKPDGVLIVHIGSGTKDRKMIPGLLQRAHSGFELVANVAEDVKAVEKHGLKDKGRTEAHHLLFLQRRQYLAKQVATA